MPTNQSEPVKNRTDIPDDEIELIDIIRIIWKWKYLIISGAAIFAVIVAIISFNIQPIYQVRMVLKSGINKEDANGKIVYLDSVENFKSIIENELIFKISDYSKNRNKSGVSFSGEYKILADNKTNKIRIFHESTDREEGVENLNYLLKMLTERYETRLKDLHDNYEYEMVTAKRQLEFSIDEDKFITSRLSDIQRSLEKYTLEIGMLNDSSESQNKSQNTLLNYSSIIEKIADLKRKHAEAGMEIDSYKKEIADLEKDKPGKQAILVAQPPTASQYPIRPKKKLIVLLAALFGFIVMLLLSFLIEYISGKKGKMLL